jgi:hypothetical protein
MRPAILRWLGLALAALLAGCANQSMPGYQRVYQGYQIPQDLADAVQARMRAEGVREAVVGRDSVGRLKLNGTYRNEDEVERAFIVAQSIVGIQSTSPFYPEHVLEKRWEREAGSALSEFFKRKKQAQANAPGKKRALVIGVNRFQNPELSDIQGEDDARLMGLVLANYGYDVMSLLGERATKANIESTIAQLDQSLSPNDTLFIYVSSHGAPPVPTPAGGEERRMSIAAYDSILSAPGKARVTDATTQSLNFQRTAVRDTLIQGLAQRPSATTRVIIDTCYSGEILKDAPSVGSTYQAKINGGAYEKASASEASWTGEAYTSKAIAFVEDGKPRAASPAQPSPTSQLVARRNYSFITATGPGEESYGPPTQLGTFESPLGRGEVLRGSFFTQSFIAYLKQLSGDVPRAFEAARTFTAQKALQVTKTRSQVPRRFTTIPADIDNLAKF